MCNVTAEEARDWRSGEEEDRLAAVVASSKARLASMAGDVWLNGYLVAGLEMRYRGVDGENLASRFVTEDMLICDNHGADATCMPKMHIGAEELFQCRSAVFTY